ncbi:DUF6404 family protein [Enterovibrio coralii]|uniref:Uncharacterized protein n=1 Tax=Enterovibrio coralii TaxID=294935 RepID=A0A135I914_9GAMM|nr:DUF6404 family protein [Enterovibrio coralii]KXF81940.1 hypothetical protein ATN88_18420 [Enterovibrio coralii]
MDYDKKLELALKELNAKGNNISDVNLKYAKTLMRFGFRLPPPHYQSFWCNLVSSGSSFGVIWGALMWFMLWEPAGKTFVECLTLMVMGGALFGLLNASFYRLRRKRLGLSTWNELGK